MDKITIIGIDIAKNVFQLHAIGSGGTVVLRRQLRRGQVLGFFAKRDPCLIGLEACATSHYWGREFQELGHDVRLIPPIYVKPYMKRQKNDAADAEAICEAVQRPTMRFVAVKSAGQQGVLMLHRARELLVGQRTALINALRGHFAELGIVVAQGPQHVGALVQRVVGRGGCGPATCDTHSACSHGCSAAQPRFRDRQARQGGPCGTPKRQDQRHSDDHPRHRTADRLLPLRQRA
jgi:transposase